MYETFVRYCLTSTEIEERGLKAIRELYLDVDRETKNVQDIVSDNGFSERTIRLDIEKVIRRFAELMEYMSIVGAGPRGKE